MIKRHKKSGGKKIMRRSCRIYLNDLNAGKVSTLTAFLNQCHDLTQYFVDLFWQRQDLSAKLADLPTVHRGRDRFDTTTRLAQALAKQAKESIRSQIEKGIKRKPRLRRHTTTLYYHFVTVEDHFGPGFDYAIRFVGSGAPKNLMVPIKSTSLINRRLKAGWIIGKTIRLGRDGSRLWVDLMMEKERPAKKTTGRIVGMDSNYKAGFMFSDGQQVGQEIYDRIQEFSKRQKNTFTEIESMVGAALKRIDWSNIRTVVLENLKYVKHGRRRTFRRSFNRRLHHWLYRASTALIERICEELGITVVFKNPWKSSQFCCQCSQWSRSNRRGDKFKCVNCGRADHADHNAATNLECLEVLGFYGIHDLQKHYAV